MTVASWFMMKPELRQDGDLHLRDEDDYIELVENGDFDVIYADHCMERMTPKFEGYSWIRCILQCLVDWRNGRLCPMHNLIWLYTCIRTRTILWLLRHRLSPPFRELTRKPGGFRHTHGGEIMLTSTTKIALSSELHMCNPY